jgi:hypothetical protein
MNRKKRPGRQRLFDNRINDGVRSTTKELFAWMKSFRKIIIVYGRLPLTYPGLVQLRRTRIDLMRGFQMSSITCVKLCKFVADEISQVVDALILVKFVDE